MGDRVKNRPSWSHETDTEAQPVPSSVTAVVLTHRRPRLATAVVRSLIEREGLPPDHVVLVINEPGGLEDAALESSVRLVRLPRNVGPAGGFGAGIKAAFADPSVRWVYLCEDDIGLFSLPSPRLADVMRRAEHRGQLPGRPVGAVVAYGRNFVGRGAHTVNQVPPVGSPYDLVPVDVASWGATLLARSVFDAGIVPDSDWFFGLEDFDFFCRIRQGGFDVLVDAVSARAVAGQQSSTGRAGALGLHRPTDDRETWRSYYHARNSVLLARRHGRPSWHAWHLAYSVRHLQKATGRAERKAILHGLWDGIRGRDGENPDYGRTMGEHVGADEDPGSSHG
jgi:rhamnopyranosyl-N-acetylglucosaminyl-diphospho-decaprenol beta-1,3/1,4-galactofuranosyltransferase